MRPEREHACVAQLCQHNAKHTRFRHLLIEFLLWPGVECLLACSSLFGLGLVGALAQAVAVLVGNQDVVLELEARVALH